MTAVIVILERHFTNRKEARIAKTIRERDAANTRERQRYNDQRRHKEFLEFLRDFSWGEPNLLRDGVERIEYCTVHFLLHGKPFSHNGAAFMELVRAGKGVIDLPRAILIEWEYYGNKRWYATGWTISYNGTRESHELTDNRKGSVYLGSGPFDSKWIETILRFIEKYATAEEYRKDLLIKAAAKTIEATKGSIRSAALGSLREALTHPDTTSDLYITYPD